MIDLQVIIDRLKATTKYTVEFSRDKEPNLQELSELPIIYIGYAMINSKNPHAPIEHDLFNTHGEDLVQSFDIMIVCETNKLSEIWKILYSNLIGWTPTPSNTSNAAISGLTYAQGGIIGLSNGKLWWMDRWNIGFPTTNVIV